MIRCASVSSYMGPYISNYILSEVALDCKMREAGQYLIHIFPEDVKEMPWVRLFEEINAKLYFIKYSPRSITSIRTLRRIFKQEKINLIHCQFGGWDFDVKLAAPFTKTIWHQRMSVNLDTVVRKVKYWIKYNVLGLIRTYNIGISQAVAEAISSIAYHKAFCIPNAIDFNRLHIDAPQIYHSDNNNSYKILLFGYSPYVKGLDIAYKACKLLNEKGIGVQLSVVSQKSSDELIKSTYSPFPLWFNVLPPSSNVSEYYQATDAFLSASRSEGFSNSLLEAIYSGCPAIYSDIPGTKWAAEFKHTYIYPVEDALKLAQTIENIIKDNISAEDIKYNRALAENKYSMTAWVQNIYNTYIGVLYS